MKTYSNEDDSSRLWRDLFQQKHQTAPDFSQHDTYSLSWQERQRITSSIQQFELGENAQGRHFLRTATQFAKGSGDHVLPDAIQAFIWEEQRHSKYLRNFMKAHNIPILQKHWVDGSFRHLRKLAGLQTCVMVLVTAEIIAVPYYRGLFAATKSPLLKSICKQILRDEADHLRFQANTLRKLRASRSKPLVSILELLHYLLLTGTAILVWKEHGKVMRCAGFDFSQFIRSTCRALAVLNRRARPESSPYKKHTRPHSMKLRSKEALENREQPLAGR